MSEHRRPSPVQPPFLDSVQGSMARVAQQPMLPTSTFLGRPEHRPSTGPSLPPIQPVRDQRQETRTLPPIHLPPLQSASANAQKPLGISQLVSSPAPTRAQPQPQPPRYHTTAPPPSQPIRQPAPQHPIYTSPQSHYGESPHDPRMHSAYAQAHGQRQVQGVQHPFDSAPPPSGFRPPQQAQSAHPSPAVTTSTASRSYYGSEEPSPRTSAATRELPSPPPQSSRLPFLYHLSIRQQPAAARACGFGERDRRVIDPPPILELKVTDREGRPDKDWDGLMAVNCTLLGKSGEDETEVPPAHPNQAATRRLMGTLVASPYEAKDEHGVAGTFFVFPDLSCRSPGKFRLHFKLIRVDPERMGKNGEWAPCVANITSNVFSVFTAKDFPGMRASSALLKSLRRQGLNVGVKKGSEARKSKGVKSKKDDSDSDESDSDGSDDGRRGSGGTGSTGDVSPRTQQPKRKTKRRRRDS